MLSLDDLRKRLEPMNLNHVARVTGVHRNTLYRFMNGGCISIKTLQVLEQWMESQCNG